MITRQDALMSLRPNEAWVWRGYDYSGIEWLSPTPMPTEAEIEQEYTRLLEEYQSQEYSRRRREEYPPLESLIVALWEQMVEGRSSEGVEAVQKIREEIKIKYPKP